MTSFDGRSSLVVLETNADEKHAVKKVVDGFADYEQGIERSTHGGLCSAWSKPFCLDLKKGGLTAFTDELNVILVDEYQDTNLATGRLVF